MVTTKSLKKKLISGDTLFDVVNFILLSCVLIAVLYPLYFVIIASFSDPDGIYQGKTYLLPYKPNITGYKIIFGYKDLWMGYANSLLYTTVGVLVNLVLTLTMAYPLSRKNLIGRGFFTFLMVFTMYFSGGLIPSYLLVRKLGMLNTIWALVIPTGISVFNVIIVRTFFQSSIPEELYESAAIDGCSNTRFFFQMLLPLSTAVVAVMVLFYGVGHWNTYFNALIYISDRSKYPLQLILREILVVSTEATRGMGEAMRREVAANGNLDKQRLAELIKFGIIIVSSLPVLILYPFLQKYFVKGVMIGSLKG
ncbi:MAG: carbohydrate ABC transporter permease [Spirochaetales bacterium]|nr:carbohydrate ABC transporter permease [Spirochaetales bacterium]